MNKEETINLIGFILMGGCLLMAVGMVSLIFFTQHQYNQQEFERLDGMTDAILYEGDCVEVGLPDTDSNYYNFGFIGGCMMRKQSCGNYSWEEC